jgi:arylsulfatase A-like enzyme
METFVPPPIGAGEPPRSTWSPNSAARVPWDSDGYSDAYGEQSCTAGRAAFMLGQHPFRTGMLTMGMPGSPHGIPDWTPTIADLTRAQGYATAQFGKNHFGDRDQHLPTNHRFDLSCGNLYDLNAEEEPETYYYPKDPCRAGPARCRRGPRR